MVLDIIAGGLWAAGSGVATFAGVWGAKAVAGQAVPTIMAKTGAIVAGVGTIHTPVTGAVMSFAATPVGWATVAVGAIGGQIFGI